MFQNIYNGKTVLITGHTGFKGTWLAIWLELLGAKVHGIALEPSTSPSHFLAAEVGQKIADSRIDICDFNKLSAIVNLIQPDFVFHLAAQSLVRESYKNPLQTWQTNVIGTLNLLESLRALDKNCACVIITSDKCYDNLEWVWGYRETDTLGGPDPYSASKGAAELAIKSHIKSYFPQDSLVRIASARAGNVIGGGDWSADRIVPDCVKAWSSERLVELRNPASTRPWQHVLEPLSGYLCLGAELAARPNLHGEPFNFGPQAQQNHSVLELVQQMSIYWDRVQWKSTLETPTHYESSLLKLNCDKALHCLNWFAVMNFEDTVRITAQWYCNFYQDNPINVSEFTANQIAAYCLLAKDKGLKWAQ
jgi:CDP-glucose 4,6-dehydratase